MSRGKTRRGATAPLKKITRHKAQREDADEQWHADTLMPADAAMSCLLRG